MRASSERSQRRQIYADFFIVYSISIACERLPVRLTILSYKECFCYLITWEYGSGCTELSSHVCNGAALRNCKSLNTLSGILYYESYSALNCELSENLEDYVLGACSALELSCQINSDYARHRDVVSTAAHCYCNVHSACSYSQHAYAAACRCMRVGTDECLTRDSESLVVQLVANAVART